MTIKYGSGHPPEWTAGMLSQELAEIEASRERGLRGELNPDGSRTVIFDNGDGLERFRARAQEAKDEADRLEAVWEL